MMNIGLTHYIVISSILFSLGIFGIITRKNAIMVLMGIELILNAANINFVAFGRFGNYIQGSLMALFVIVMAAAEAAIALAIVLNIYKNFANVNVDEIDKLKD
jgi:NADH-quinone oxidoreductase subunit K